MSLALALPVALATVTAVVLLRSLDRVRAAHRAVLVEVDATAGAARAVRELRRALAAGEGPAARRPRSAASDGPIARR